MMYKIENTSKYKHNKSKSMYDMDNMDDNSRYRTKQERRNKISYKKCKYDSKKQSKIVYKKRKVFNKLRETFLSESRRVKNAFIDYDTSIGCFEEDDSEYICKAYPDIKCSFRLFELINRNKKHKLCNCCRVLENYCYNSYFKFCKKCFDKVDKVEMSNFYNFAEKCECFDSIYYCDSCYCMYKYMSVTYGFNLSDCIVCGHDDYCDRCKECQNPRNVCFECMSYRQGVIDKLDNMYMEAHNHWNENVIKEIYTSISY